jgi:sugar (pentulose or hexulose) kinase
LPRDSVTSTEGLILAIDVGSSWCKAACIDRSGRFLSEGRAPTRTSAANGDALFDHHWCAIVRSVREATTSLEDLSINKGALAAVNFSCRGLLGVGVDADGNPFTLADDANAIARFRDTSSMVNPEGEVDDALVRYGYGSRHGALLGWLRKNDNERWRSIYKAGGLRDWIALKLTGAWVTDHTIGPGQPEWPPEIIAESGLPEHAFARILGPTEFAGPLLPGIAKELGLPPGLPVVSGMHDGAAANVGVGAVNPGDTCLTLGTNFSLRAVTGKRLSNAFSYVILPGCWAWVDNVPNASGRLDTAAFHLSTDGETLGEAILRLSAQAADIPPGCDSYQFPVVPPRDENALERALNDAIRSGIPAPVIYRAVVEQIAFEVGWLLARARSAGATPDRFVATGGSARNTLLMSILSAVIGKPISRGETEAGLLGAAISASVGLGWFDSIENAVSSLVHNVQSREPDSSDVARYRELWNEWATARHGTEP